MDRALAVVPLSARGLVALVGIAGDAVPTQAHLARRLGLGPGAMSDMLRRLERAGLVRRDLSRRGGRQPHPPGLHQAVALTEAGRAVLAESVGIAAKVEDEWARCLDGPGENMMPGLRAYGLRRWLVRTGRPCDANPATD